MNYCYENHSALYNFFLSALKKIVYRYTLIKMKDNKYNNMLLSKEIDESPDGTISSS